MKKLTPAPIIDRSGLRFDSHPAVQPLRKGHYQVILTTIAGDAPKDFLRIYEYGAGNKASPHNWPAHIAKVGQKWYPNESITEHLLTRIGQFLGIEIADSQLMFVRGQLRFLSRYFLKKRESLVHGAEIFAGYLQDEKFVEEVEKKNQARDIFTFQFVEDALLDRFPEDVDEILQGFVKLLGFDALVGNNDRHFYNWGVITDVAGRTKPRFSPVYDTARALFWNTTDAAIEETRISALDQLVERSAGRPAEIRTRLSEVRSALDEIERDLGQPYRRDRAQAHGQGQPMQAIKLQALGAPMGPGTGQ
jgi:hypothetical protein